MQVPEWGECGRFVRSVDDAETGAHATGHVANLQIETAPCHDPAKKHEKVIAMPDVLLQSISTVPCMPLTICMKSLFQLAESVYMTLQD